jgi:branched-subunit amino acid aminotransferase/4-amino-4-deoxychorismate lyase
MGMSMTRLTSAADRVLAWTPDGELRTTLAPSGELLAADSWLVHDGYVRGIERHAGRFLDACTDVGTVSAAEVGEFWQAALAELPREGHWFPRVELTTGSSPLRLRVRPAPPRTRKVRVWVSDRPDPRSTPLRKGPDLTALARLRQEAVNHGAHEALLTSADGVVLEGAYSSLLWWQGSVLCAPEPGLPVLPGVTSRLIQEHARRRGARISYCRPTLDDLDGREVWLVNALHGIRPVASWKGADLTAGAAWQAASWREWLDELAEPLPVPSRIRSRRPARIESIA